MTTVMMYMLLIVASTDVFDVVDDDDYADDF